jgi:hypothetical protein
MADDLFDDVLERWMRERPAPRPPAGFTAAVMTRVSQERWQVERYWDLGFNLAVAGGLALVVAGIFGLVYLSGLSVVGRDATLLFLEALSTTAAQLTPVLPTYVVAFALTVSALGLWWWVEN